MVPPTPPIGLTPPVLSAGTMAMPMRPAAPDPAFAQTGPSTAPVVSPQPSQAPSPAAAPAKPNLGATFVDPRPPAMEPAPNRVCHVCATVNEPSVRYCESCGSTLQPVLPRAAPAVSAPAPAAPPPAPRAQPPQPVVPSAPAPAPMAMPFQAAVVPMAPLTPPSPPAPPIQPARVVDLGAPPAPAAATRACPRCSGRSEWAASFCRFCGGALAEGGAVPPTPPTPGPQLEPLSQRQTEMTPALAVAEAPSLSASQIVTPVLPRSAAPRSVPAPPAAVAPTPPPAVSAPIVGCLILVAKDGSEGPAYPLVDQVDIGRVEGNIIIADDRYLSPRHGRIVRRGGQLFLRDLGSVNGVYLRLAPPPSQVAGEAAAPLRDQDLFLVGQQVIRFEIVREAEEGLGPAMEHGTLLFGTPTTRLLARLSQRSIEGVTRDVYHLAKRETVLGRESGDIVFTEDPFLSRRHAAIRASAPGPQDGLPAGRPRAADEPLARAAPAAPPPPIASIASEKDSVPSFSLVDLGSSNGSYIQIRAEVPLRSGDEFRIGQQLFRVDLTRNAGTSGV